MLASSLRAGTQTDILGDAFGWFFVRRKDVSSNLFLNRTAEVSNRNINEMEFSQNRTIGSVKIGQNLWESAIEIVISSRETILREEPFIVLCKLYPVQMMI